MTRQKEKRGRGWLRLIGTAGLLVLWGFALPALASDYSLSLTPDNTWGEGTDYGLNGGAAQAHADKDNGTMQVFSNSSGYGKAWAKAWVSKDFTYAHESWYNEIKINYSIRGEMNLTGNAENELYVMAELKDLNTGAKRTKRGLDEDNWSGSINDSYRTIAFSAKLEKSHNYQLTVIAYARTDASGGAALVDFYNNVVPHRVDVSHVCISHAHNWVYPWCGDDYGYCAHSQFSPLQDRLNEAFGIMIKAKPDQDYDDEVIGVRMQLRDFEEWEAELDQYGRWVEVTAGIMGNNGIPDGASGYVSTRLCLESSCGTADDCEMIAYWYSKNPCDETALAVPNHGWIVSHPVPVITDPSSYTHTFIMKNPDPSQVLRIGSLTFLVTTEDYEDFRQVPFPDDALFELNLTAAQPTWSLDFVTEGPFTGGYIYFGYELFDPDDPTGKVICNGWGRHQVACPLETDVQEIQGSQGGTVNFSLDVTKENAGRFYWIFAGMSGCTPGTPLAGGTAVLPLNFDMVTMIMINLGMPGSGLLNADGQANATLYMPPMPLYSDMPMFFAFAMPKTGEEDWYASNGVSLIIKP